MISIEIFFTSTQSDIKKLVTVGADYVFLPQTEELYQGARMCVYVYVFNMGVGFLFCQCVCGVCG